MTTLIKKNFEFEKELKQRMIQVRNGGAITPHIFWFRTVRQDIVKAAVEAMKSEIEKAINNPSAIGMLQDFKDLIK